MKRLSKILTCLFMLAILIGNTLVPAFAKNSDEELARRVSFRSIGAGALSLLIWPGIGQAVNSQKGDKVLTHALLGLIPPYRFWSCYDALVDRDGGYWEGRI